MHQNYYIMNWKNIGREYTQNQEISYTVLGGLSKSVKLKFLPWPASRSIFEFSSSVHPRIFEKISSALSSCTRVSSSFSSRMNPQVSLIWQPLINLSEKSMYLAHNGLNRGKAISSQGFALPLKWMTPAFLASARPVFSWYPRPNICQKGSMTWTWSWNAISPGGRVPSCHRLRSEFKFCVQEYQGFDQMVYTNFIDVKR